MKRLQITQEVEVQNLESLKQDSEKDILLEEFDAEMRRVKNISFKNLIFVFLALFLALLLILPKIYVSNQIYYISKNINSMHHAYTALKEENSHLQRELESVRYQLEVIDELEE